MARIAWPDTIDQRLRDITARIGALEGITRISTLPGNPAAQAADTPLPDDQGLVAWSLDPALVSGTATPALGVLHLAAVQLRTTRTVSNVILYVGSGGASLTAGQTYAALLTSAGALVDYTGDQSGAWAGTVNAPVTMPLSSPHALTPGAYYAAWIVNGTTAPTMGTRGTFSALLNVGIASAASYRFAANGSSVTTIPATTTLSANTAAAAAWWAALS